MASAHDQSVPAAPARGGRAFDAAIFDMDGVVTRTAAVHARAWKEMFDAFLRARAAAGHEAFREFTPAEYLRHVDGRPRYAGVAAFLEARGIRLAFGAPEDPPDAATACGLGNRKNELFNAIIAREGAGVYESTVGLIRDLRAAGIAVGLATSSRNSALILARSGVAPLFATVVDGLVSARQGLAGKPAPDIFLTASTNLGVPGARAVVFEDAVSGVEAGARGGFALVIGIAREGNAAELRRHGADLVVSDLAETSLKQIEAQVRQKRGERE